MFLFTRFILSFIAVLFISASIFAQNGPAVKIQIITDEADAVLNVLDKRYKKKRIAESDWQKIFSTEGYRRLKKREESFKRSFEDADFKKFVFSEELLKRRSLLAETLFQWKKINADNAGKLALVYLPENSRIEAKIYPVIKPKKNSFVFEVTTDPAIFLYLDPTMSKEKFENTLAHELHHIGYANTCSQKYDYKSFPPNTQKVLRWTGAFGEGFAMLAAAGGTKNHPHAVSSDEEKNRWDKDIANFNNDLPKVEDFFLKLSKGELSREEEIKIARSFYGIQGPWYTMGWKMAVVIEETLGRKELIDCMCDKSKLFKAYNQAVSKYNRKDKEKLQKWSMDLINLF